MSAKLFCDHSQVTSMPYRVVLKIERRTSNVQRGTSNNDVAPLRSLISFVLKIRCQNLNDYFFLFIFSIQSRQGVIGRSMFDVQFLTKLVTVPRYKSNLSPMGEAPNMFRMKI